MAIPIRHEALQTGPGTANHKPFRAFHLRSRAACHGAFQSIDQVSWALKTTGGSSEMRLADGNLFRFRSLCRSANDERVELDTKLPSSIRETRSPPVWRSKRFTNGTFRLTAQQVFATADARHPLVAEMHGWGTSQHLRTVGRAEPPEHYDFQELRLTPAETRGLTGADGQQERGRLSNAQPVAPRARRSNETRDRRS